MNLKKLALSIGVALGIVLASQVPLFGQEHTKHHRYKLIEPATFGGPGSRMNGFVYSTFSSIQDLNNAGTLTGWADTSMQDPYQFTGNAVETNFCFEGDCYVTHAFQWQNGVRSDLGALPGGLSSATSWVSANGLIAGTSQNGETDPLDPGFPEVRAVLWRNGKITDLGTLREGGSESGAQAINSWGQVVGWAINTIPDPLSMAYWSTLYNYYAPITPYQMRAFLWQNGVMRDLGTLGSGTNAFAMAINEAGQVIGISYIDSTPNQMATNCSFGAPLPTQDPFLWENGKMTDLGNLGGTCSFPSWINNYGEVVGNSNLAGDQIEHAFLWTKARGMEDLGTLGGTQAQASFISDSGAIVGGSTLEGDAEYDAYLWDGKMHDLGTVDGSNCTYAFSVNAKEQVVGNDCGGTFAFLWEDGGPMVDLSTLIINPSSTLPFLGVITINDLGEIAGMGGDTSDLSHAIVLIPCDSNHPNIEGCDYSLVDWPAAAEVRPAEITKAPAAAASQPKMSPAALMARFRPLPAGHNHRFGTLQTSPQ